MPSLYEIFRVSSQPSSEVEAKKEKAKQKGSMQKLGAFLASRNPATLDASLFDSTEGSDDRKRKRK